MINKDIMTEEYLNHNKLDERRKFAITDIAGREEEAGIEVNWNKLAKKNGYLKLSIGDKEVVVSREHLYAVLFLLGSAEEQTKMVSPFVKKAQVTKYNKMIGVTVTQDIKKGDTVNVPLEFTLNPDTHQVIIGKGSVDAIEKNIVNK